MWGDCEVVQQLQGHARPPPVPCVLRWLLALAFARRPAALQAVGAAPPHCQAVPPPMGAKTAAVSCCAPAHIAMRRCPWLAFGGPLPPARRLGPWPEGLPAGAGGRLLIPSERRWCQGPLPWPCPSGPKSAGDCAVESAGAWKGEGGGRRPRGVAAAVHVRHVLPAKYWGAHE